MIDCPWCGTSYLTFQSNCKNCGGPLRAVEETTQSAELSGSIPMPPPAPRSISKNYAWRLLLADGWAVAAMVFILLGAIFTFLGAGLTIGIVTAFVGIPFLLLGLAFLGIGGGALYWRYTETEKVVNVLRIGEAKRGRITGVEENFSVRVNGRHPWIIRYEFEVDGKSQEGKVVTLKQPGQELQAGMTVCVLYLPSAPQVNCIYPHP